MSNGDQARKYVLLDASALAGYFIPTAAETVKACERVTVLVEAVRKRAVDQVLLYLPNSRPTGHRSGFYSRGCRQDIVPV